MVEDPVLTTAFEILKNEDGNATIEDKLEVALRDLGITDKCHGFVIDGDMAIKMADHFNKEHPGSRSVGWNLNFVIKSLIVSYM